MALHRGEFLDNITPSTITENSKSQSTRTKTQSTPREFPVVSTIGTPQRTHRVSFFIFI